MRNAVTLIVIALALVCSAAQAAEQPTLNAKQVIQKVRKGVIRVQTASVQEDELNTNAGGGSGFIIEVDYDKGIFYGVTNHHVAGHASSVSATIWDGTVYNGELVATEPGIDVSLIRLHGIPDERNLPDSQKTIIPVVLGDSDQVKVGEMGLAMGNPGAQDRSIMGANRSEPFGDFLLTQTATLNVVTGRDTPLEFPVGIWQQNRDELGYQYGTNMDYAFRMSTAINGGNSGGPLFNNKAEVIGINFYGGSSSLTQNSNHAIPINLAKDFVYQILNTGKFEKPWLGLDIIFPPSIKGDDTYVEFRERFRPKDLEIFGVRTNSPAEAAGFKRGDVIEDINGQKFKSPEDIRLWIFSQNIGTPLSVRVMRNGKILPDPIKINVGVKRTHDAEFSV